MLLSLSDRYIFLSNPKAASTSFETAFGDQCEIASCQGNQFGHHPLIGGGGKHTNYRECLQVFRKLFLLFMPLDRTFVFGIVRDPFARIESHYRFFTRHDEARAKTGIGDMTFETFLRTVVDAPESKVARSLVSQHDFFRGEDSDIALNYLIRLENLAGSLDTIKREVGLDFGAVVGSVKNATAARTLTVEDPGLRREFEAYAADDFALYESKADCLLKPVTAGADVDIEGALRWFATRGSRFDLASSLIYKIAARLRTDPDFRVSDVLSFIDGRIAADLN